MSIEELKKREQLAEEGGGADKQVKIKESGKLTARQRIDHLLDQGSFVEVDKFVTHRSQNFGLDKKKFYGDGVITGWGTLNKRTVFVFSQDATVFGGALSSAHAAKICKIMDLAKKNGAPIIGINDSGGARIQEGVESLAGYADIFLRNTIYSGCVPQISIILGACAGGAVYSPAITDFVLMSSGASHMFITGPDVIKAVTREQVDKESLGGAAVHSEKSGVTHLVGANEKETLDLCKLLHSYIPDHNNQKPAKQPFQEKQDPFSRLSQIIPNEHSKTYNVKEVILDLCDDKSFLELQPEFAKNIVIGFARLGGAAIGVVANQPQYLAGCLDINASSKAARFVRFCDCFNIPILTLVDVPGFLPGVNQEHGGIIRHGAKLLYAYAEATVPKVTLILRKAYGGAYDVMSSKHLRGDVNYSLPGAEIAVMGAEGAVNIIFKKELMEAEKINPEEFARERERLTAEYKKKFANPWVAAELGYIDGVINPAESRKQLISAFAMLEQKADSNPPKKHGNIPL
ncbi:MAG TPA: acyl-CoA carboxylase subunit beta [Oligoflexia bacterium]|mgnify:CR=1 FL=1|nr:acyl-CoA carboxylase subunit beta [Oligoflexia bacterium]HMP27781.1 acyl-CoA carboxylase subunit beta [Oligoflexia bacterium]